MKTRLVRFAISAAVCALTGGAAFGGTITDSDIQPLPFHAVGAGLGTLDYILFASAAGGSGNTTGAFNGDNSNTDMPTGGTSLANESYITSIGELRDFYRLQFPDGMGGSTVGNIVLHVDINQIGPSPTVYLEALNVVLNYDLFSGADPRNDPAANDLSSAQQNATGSNYTGGTLLACLDTSPKSLTEVNSGGGWADYAITLNINPFDPSFSDSDRILFHWFSSNHNGGPEKIFLSGVAGTPPVIPLPPAVLAGGVLLAAAAGWKRFRRV